MVHKFKNQLAQVFYTEVAWTETSSAYMACSATSAGRELYNYTFSASHILWWYSQTIFSTGTSHTYRQNHSAYKNMGFIFKILFYTELTYTSYCTEKLINISDLLFTTTQHRFLQTLQLVNKQSCVKKVLSRHFAVCDYNARSRGKPFCNYK